jgi:hypothetical protein
VDEEKFSPRFPQRRPGFAQPVPKLITRLGDNAFTRMSEVATTCAVYAQKLSPGVHRVWETGAEGSAAVRYVVFRSELRLAALMGTLVD